MVGVMFTALSFFILIVFLLVIIMRAIKKRPIKKFVIGAVVSAECFVIGTSKSMDVFVAITGILIFIVSLLSIIILSIKKQRTVTRAVIGTALGVVIFLIGTGMNGQGVIPQAKPDISEEPQPVEANALTSQEEKPPFTLTSNNRQYIGVENDNVGFVLTGIDEVNSVGIKEEHKADGKFLILHILIQNNQTEAITIDANQFEVIDNQRRTYSYDDIGSIYYAFQNQKEKNLANYQINPEVNTAGIIVFDVSKDLEPSSVAQLKIRGDFLDEEVTLPLVVSVQEN